MNRAICTIIIFFCLSLSTEAQKNRSGQSTRDSLRSFTTKLLQKATKKKSFKKVAIWDFNDPRNEQSDIGYYVAEQVSIYATDLDSITILDRQNTSSFIKEHALKDKEFLIEKNALLELGKMSGAEVLVVGKVSVFESECAIQVYLKVLDANTAETLAASEDYIPVDRQFADASGLSLNCVGTGNTRSLQAGKGYNHPVESNEQKNNKQTLLEQGCMDNNTGTICFFNSTGDKEFKVEFYLENSTNNSGKGTYYSPYEAILKPGESKCFYELKASESFSYTVYLGSVQNTYSYGTKVYDQGTIQVEKCKSKTYTIKGYAQNTVKKNLQNQTEKTLEQGVRKVVNRVLGRKDQ